MTTQTQEAPAQKAENTVKLVSARKKVKTGIPTEGLLVFIGYPKSGKTTLAADFPDSYVLELEKGGGDRVDGRIHDVSNLDEFRGAIQAAVDAEDVRTIVIDTIDEWGAWTEDEIARSYGLSNILERKAGVDGFELWGEYGRRIEKLVNYMKGSGKLFIVLAHCKDPKLDDQGKLITPAGMNLRGKGGMYIASHADAIGNVTKRQVADKTRHFLSFQGGPLGHWGSRIEELNDKTIQLEPSKPYESFSAAFGAVAAQEPTAANGNGNGNGGNGNAKRRK